MAEKIKKFNVIFEGVGVATGKMRNDIAVSWPMMNEHFELATDEGPFHGGDGTAPPPLALFTAALTGCLMTQLRAFAKRLDVQIHDLKVNTKLHWSAEQEGNKPYVSMPELFTLDIEMDTDVNVSEKIALIQAATKGCFIEQSLSDRVKVKHRLKDNSGWIEV